MASLGWVTYFVLVFMVVFVFVSLAAQDHDLCDFGDIDQTNGTIFLNESGSTSKLCSRVVRIQGPGRLLLNLTDFRIAADEGQLEIFDGPHSGSQKFTNYSKPLVFSASGNAIFIRFLRKNGLKVVSSYFRASFNAVPYPAKCLCRPVKNGRLECEDKYQKRVCYVKCHKGYYDISLGKNITCDMHKEGKWDIDIHERGLSCQKVSAPLKIRLRVSFNFLNGTCEGLNLDLIKKAFEHFLTNSSEVQKNGKCFADEQSKCTSKRIEVKCENGSRTIDVNITDEVEPREDLNIAIAKFETLYHTYNNDLDFGTALGNNLGQSLTINMTSLVKGPTTPLCQNSTLSSFFQILTTEKRNFSKVCTSCPLHHFYEPKTSQCMVCPQGSSPAPEGALSCRKGSLPGVPIPHKCDTKCMLGKQYNKSSGFCEWCPYDQFQDSTQNLNPTCQSCPLNYHTPFSGADDTSQCFRYCDPGTSFNLETHDCHKCPVDTYQDQKNLFTQCKTCGNGRHTAAEGSKEEDQCFGPCNKGNFFDEQARKCTVCSMHTYQDEEDQPQCKNCSDGKRTLKQGAKNKSSCILPCQAGQLFKKDTRKCENCSEGNYQDQSNHLEAKCKTCKTGKTTEKSGATSASDCILACPPGEFSDQKRCQKCAKGYFQDLPNQNNCTQCPAGKTTREEGQTNQTACVYLCRAGTFLDSTRKICSSCPFGTYQGTVDHSFQNCTVCPWRKTSVPSGAVNISFCININCTMFPCRNGASCSPEGVGFSCTCGDGLHGKLCEVIENKDKLRTVEMSLNFTSLEWEAQLADHKTDKYNMTKGLIESVIGELMDGSNAYIAVEVTDLKKGSVVAYLTLYFGENSDLIPGRKLQTAVACGSVGNLTVSSLEILQQTCTTALGMESGYIKDTQITSSKQHTKAEPGKGRLNGTGWQDMHNDTNKFLQIDFQQAVNITAVASQGVNVQGCFVKSYKLVFSDDGLNWTHYGNSKEGKIFVGNNNSGSVVKNYLESPVSAHYIRFNPQSWNQHICMRVEVYGCLLNPTILCNIPSRSPPVVTTAKLVHPTVLASKSKFGWGAYLGITFFALLLLGVVIAICYWKQKSKSKRHTVEQDSLLGMRESDGIGGYRYVEKAADSPDREEIEENQV